MGSQYRKAKYGNWQLSSTPPNNCIIMKDDSVAVIENFVKKSDSIYIVGRQFLNDDDFFSYPPPLTEQSAYAQLISN